MKIRLLGVLVLVVWLSSPALGDLGRGLTAYNQGDYASALKEWRPVAEQGDAKAQAMLGHMYSKGQGVAQNDAEAVRWYRAAAEQGHGTAQFNLGNALREGRGVPQNNTEAVRWYRAAAEQGDADAQTSLGFMHLEGQGVPQSDAEAMRLTRAAAEQGHVDAQSNLGLMYAGGRGAPENLVLAYKWMSLSAAQGGEVARENVGILEKHYMTPEQIAEAKRLVAEAQGQTQESLAAEAQGQAQKSTGVVQSAHCQNNVPAKNPDSVYIDHGDGTVTDTRTGLMWKQCAEGLSGATCQTGSAQGFNHGDALAQAEASTFAHYSDWRLPNTDELKSLLENCRRWPAINTNIFPNTTSSTDAWFWSDSPSRTRGLSAAVNFDMLTVHVLGRDGSYRVRLVRGGSPEPKGQSQEPRGQSQEPRGQTQELTGVAKLEHAVAQSDPCKNKLPPSHPDSVYIDHGDGTVTDTRTGLMWKRCAEGMSWTGTSCTGSANTWTWQGALEHADAVSGWRLPSIDELRSIVEQCEWTTRMPSAVNHQVFPGTPPSKFWSASPVDGSWRSAWGVNFRDGHHDWFPTRMEGGRVRLVSGGQ